ncbi:hypothetical protein AB0G04_28890 [Actinoplanes sp. NPDC023801]|uniref:hypothetical protein n=1 Tax=Actinoplanes sp. NPDC023801 TaxID=3154595 RepID=UPI0033F9BDE2
MTGFVSQFVSYSQYEIGSAGDSGDLLDIYTAGDDLLHVGGPGGCTGFTGLHTGEVEFRVLCHATEPPLENESWDAASETTLWCPDGRLTVIGLMSEGRDPLTDIPVPGDTLLRVRVYARNRIHESGRTDTDPPEQHEVHVWPVDEETGQLSLFDDGARAAFRQRPDRAAEWAMLRLLAEPTGNVPRAPGEGAPASGPPGDGRRVAVVRTAVSPVRLPATIPAGDLKIHLLPAGDGALGWQWVAPDGRTVPDERPSTVRQLPGPDGTVTVRHEGVPAGQAVLLGLIWDHLLGWTDGAPFAWEATLRARAAEAERIAERARQRRDAEAAAAWGGSVPTERLRRAGYLAQSLARMDRPLLDRLAALTPDEQHHLACRIARAALRRAGLDRIDWIAEGMAAAEAGGPMPAFFSEQHGRAAYERMLADPRTPRAVIEIPGKRRPVLLAAAAFGVLTALTYEDPLAAVAGVVHLAATAHGPDAARFLASVPTG